MSKLNTDDVTVKTITANGSIGTAGQFLTANGTGSYWSTQSFFAVNQTWQDVKASRSTGTTYTNNTQAPIMVSVAANNSGTAALGAITATVGGVVVGIATTGDDEGAQAVVAYGTLTFVVPVSATYSIANTASLIQYWAELR
jgi:hypothetical protein